MSPSVSCVDCGVAFFGNDYAGHTSCVTEKEKYEGKLYKGKKTVPVGVPTYSRSSEKRTKSDKKEKHSKRKLQEAHEETSESKKYKKANREGQDSKPDSSSSKPVTSTLLISSCLEKKSVQPYFLNPCFGEMLIMFLCSAQDGISLETLLKKVNKKLAKKNEKACPPRQFVSQFFCQIFSSLEFFVI